MAIAIVLLATGPGQAQEEAASEAEADASYAVPHFRHINPHQKEPDLDAANRTVRFLTDAEFPPFSYQHVNGELAGFSVAVANAVCRDLRLECEFIVKPWNALVPSLLLGEGDVILAGIKRTPDNFETLDFTRPFYTLLARFAVRSDEAVGRADARALADKRIGVRAGTAHEAFLQAHFEGSTIQGFATDTAAREALREGTIDALFGDATRLMYWIAGSSSQDCCRLAAGAYADPAYFNTGLTLAVRRGERDLRQALDHGLDRLQLSGRYGQIFRQFFPLSPW